MGVAKPFFIVDTFSVSVFGPKQPCKGRNPILKYLHLVDSTLEAAVLFQGVETSMFHLVCELNKRHLSQRGGI